MSGQDETRTKHSHRTVRRLAWGLAVLALGIAGFEQWRESASDAPERTVMLDPRDADETGESAAPAHASSPPPSPPDREVRDVTPDGVHSGPVLPYRELASREPEPAAAEKEEQRFFQTVVVDAGTLKARGHTLRLAGIEAPGAAASCTDAAGRDWPCGRAAKAALNLFLRGRAVDCEIVQREASDLVATCRTGGEDLGGWLVAQGWAKPREEGGYTGQGEEAARQKLGLYRAEWTRGAAAR